MALNESGAQPRPELPKKTEKREGVEGLEQGKVYRVTKTIVEGSTFSSETVILAGTRFKVVEQTPKIWNSAQYGPISTIKFLVGREKGREISIIPSIGFLNSIEEVKV